MRTDTPYRPSFLRQLLLIVAAAALALLWSWDALIDERIVTLRLFLIASAAAFAFLPPFMLFPDPWFRLLQLGNREGSNLLRHLLRHMRSVVVVMGVMVVVILMGDLHAPASHLAEKTGYAAAGVGFLAGLWMLAVSRYTGSGLQSQFWKEDKRGQQLRRQMADYMKYPLDPGSIPTLLNTVLIAGLGMLVLSLGAWASQVAGPWAEWGAGALVFLTGAAAMMRMRGKMEQSYYASHAFYSEFFGDTEQAAYDTSRVEVSQLWWVPGALKTHVWALLLQLDRRLPAGRALMAGHVLVWLFSYQRPGEAAMSLLWMVFALLHHLLIVMSYTQTLVPGWWRRWLAPPAVWVAAHAWIQGRWLLLLAVSITLNGMIFGVPGRGPLIAILSVYAGSAFLLSGVLYFLTVKTKNQHESS
ncbi:MAG: hypothetical protein ACNA78_03055 [Balneolaceae bacterium]